MTYKICRFNANNSNQALYGFIEGDSVIPFSENLIDALNKYDRIDEAFKNLSKQPEHISLSDVTLLPPAIPTKIVCVGRNYLEHALELGNKMPEEPLLFLKPPSAVIGHNSNIIIPPQSSQVEHEGEVGVVIGRIASKLTESDNPLNYVLGYTCINDVTARDLQRKDVQFTRGKSFDTFCPVGPYIATNLNPTNLTVTTKVNGIIKQHGNTKDMAFPIALLIRYISNIMTLYPGDLIATGTPAGVSALSVGDVVEVEVDGVGILSNPVTK